MTTLIETAVFNIALYITYWSEISFKINIVFASNMVKKNKIKTEYRKIINIECISTQLYRATQVWAGDKESIGPTKII